MRLTLRVLGSAIAAVTCLAAFGQFIPDKAVVIHPAVESQPEQRGSIQGPGAGLGATPPTPPAPRPGAGAGGRAARGGGRATPPIPAPPPAPEINAAGAAVEQTKQGSRAAIAPGASFDGLGEGFSGRAFPGASSEAEANGGRGGIDISLAVGPDHDFEILNGNMAVFSKKGKKSDSTGKLL